MIMFYEKNYRPQILGITLQWCETCNADAFRALVLQKTDNYLFVLEILQATSHLTISMREQHKMSKIQRNNCTTCRNLRVKRHRYL